MPLEKKSPCKVNLLLNILGKRADGFHELETVMHPVNFCDELTFERGGAGVQLTCSDPELPVDSKNLVHRAAAGVSGGGENFRRRENPSGEKISAGRRPRRRQRQRRDTLSALNELFGPPLPPEKLHELAAALGSDIPFFLQDKPALATGRGEKVQPLENFPALRGKAFFLIHPGFGISTPWAYQNLARFPGRAERPGRPRAKSDFDTSNR